MSLGEMTNQVGAKKARKRGTTNEDRTRNGLRKFSTRLNPMLSMYSTEDPEAPDTPAELERGLSGKLAIHL